MGLLTACMHGAKLCALDFDWAECTESEYFTTVVSTYGNAKTSIN